MTLTLDLSEDLYVCDGLESMTLKVAGHADTELLECVLTEPYERKEMEPTHGQVPQDDMLAVWPIAKSDKPPLGSILVDEDETYWTILRLTTKQHVDCYEAKCRDLSIVPSVSNEATVLKATYGKGQANEATATWRGAFSGESPPTDEDVIPARFQPSEEMAQLFPSADFTRTTYRVVLDEPLPIELAGGEYRLVDSNGYRYRIMEYFAEARIDRLPVALAVRILEGSEYWGYGPPSEA